MPECKSRLNLKPYEAAHLSSCVLVLGRGPLTEDALKTTEKAISVLAHARVIRELQYIKKHASPKVAQQASDALKKLLGSSPECTNTYIEMQTGFSFEDVSKEINRMCDEFNRRSA